MASFDDAMFAPLAPPTRDEARLAFAEGFARAGRRERALAINERFRRAPDASLQRARIELAAGHTAAACAALDQVDSYEQKEMGEAFRLWALRCALPDEKK
jgi:hypothetical protein